MFNRRIKWFAILLLVLAAVVVTRLAEIQVVAANEYEALGERMLTRPVSYLPAPRGAVYDRNGVALLSDEPASDICVHYSVLTFTNRAQYLRAVARQMQRQGRFPEDMSLPDIVRQLQDDISTMWQRLSELTGVPISEMVADAEIIRQRVERIRAIVERHSGVSQPIGEETAFHPIIKGADNDLVLRVRLELERYPWLRVVPSSRRVSHDADSLCHLLGQLGQASRERIDEDPYADDLLRQLRPGDRCGVSGVERLAELTLRGVRGRVATDYEGAVVSRTEPQHGGDVRLTIDKELQDKTLEFLRDAVESLDQPSGGAAVVLDADTREVLALVSYPAYHFDTYREDYNKLSHDTKRLPTQFRAVETAYPPGSTCKAVTVVGALSDGKVGLHETLTCTGHLLPDVTTKYRCWIYRQGGREHGPQEAEEAIKNSCNIYMFKAADRLGVDRLCEWFDKFGLGRSPGTGLLRERNGINPNAEWLEHSSRRARRERGDVWGYAIGQGDVTATPLQVANVAASIATGRWEPVKLAQDERGDWLNPCYSPPIVFNEQAVSAVRTGMWRGVNERGGTGVTAHLSSKTYVMCGKTGSAQSELHVVNRLYTLEWPDGRRTEVVAQTEDDALAQFEEPLPKIVGWRAHERYPAVLPDETNPAHAWFMGFTQLKSTPRGEKPQGKCYAICVLVEFGASGGRSAAPVAKDIAEWLLQREEEHDADAPTPSL